MLSRRVAMVAEALTLGLHPAEVVAAVESTANGARTVHLEPACVDGQGTLVLLDLAEVRDAYRTGKVSDDGLLLLPGGRELCLRCSVQVAALDHLFTGPFADGLRLLSHATDDLRRPVDLTDPRSSSSATLYQVGSHRFLAAALADVEVPAELAGPVTRARVRLEERVAAAEATDGARQTRLWWLATRYAAMKHYSPELVEHLGEVFSADDLTLLRRRIIGPFDPAEVHRWDVIVETAEQRLTSPAGWMVLPVHAQLTLWLPGPLPTLGPGDLGPLVSVPALRELGMGHRRFVVARVPEVVGLHTTRLAPAESLYLPDPEQRLDAVAVAGALELLPAGELGAAEATVLLGPLARACADAALPTG